jgi:osmotically-inducible protein OsmY
MSDTELVRQVIDELLWDPVIDPAAIAVAADNGTVTLRGTVGSYVEKRHAKRAAKRVGGVKQVDNQLDVELMTVSRVDDSDLRGAVLQALALNILVPPTIDASADDGVITLTGLAKHQYERDEAELTAGNVSGVKDLHDHVDLALPAPDAGKVQKEIRKAFKRNARIDAENVEVATSNGTVTLTGVVSSWAEHDEAMATAWAAPGVAHVNDRISVDYY